MRTTSRGLAQGALWQITGGFAINPPRDTGKATAWWKQPAALALFASNLIPLVGVLYFHWSLFAVLLLFWLDSVVIGVLSAARARLAQLDRGFPSGRPTPEWRTRTVAGGLFGFFFFTAIHGVFLVLLFGSLELRQLGKSSMSEFEYLAEILLQPEIAAAVLAAVASRGFDFYVNYLRPRAYETAHVSEQMAAAFGRVIVLQAALIGGGFLIAWLRAPVATLVLLVLLKTAGDVLALAYRKR